jgi:hypothetical protein
VIAIPRRDAPVAPPEVEPHERLGAKTEGWILFLA